MRIPPVLLGFAALTASAVPVCSQVTGTAVVPRVGPGGPANYSTSANFATSYPWNRKTASMRVQYAYDPSEMPAFPVTITDIRFRPTDGEPTTTRWTGGTYGAVTIQMSTSPLSWDAQNATFASNHGADLTTVYSGAVTLAAGASTGYGVPSNPYVAIKLGTPFNYDPSKGPLVLDISVDGTKYTGGTTWASAITYNTHMASRVFATSITAATGNVEKNLGLVMEYDFTVAGTRAAFHVDRTTLPTGGTVQFTDDSVTSAAGGVLVRDWDLDGDGRFGDASTANPTWTFNAPGLYNASLRITTSQGVFTETKTRWITVATPAPSVPDVFQFQLNEVRGNVAANSAVGSAAPAQGTVVGTTWQGQSKGAAYGPNEPGFGMMQSAGTTNTNYVDTGFATTLTGSLSVTWWQRMAATAPKNAYGYAWGALGAGSLLRCFNRGDAGNGISFRGNAQVGDIDPGIDLHHTNWVHLAIVIDDANGTATWYVDGLRGRQTTFAPNTFTETIGNFGVGKHGTSTSTHSLYYDTDDFRVYGKALSYAEVLGAMMAENPSTGSWGTACSTGAKATIQGTGGLPALGNAAFGVAMNGAPASAPYGLVIGFLANAGNTLPIDLSAALGRGCLLETQVTLLFLGQTSAGGAASLALPIPASSQLIGAHVYAQGAFDTPSVRGTTDLLDINVQQ